MHVDHRLSSRAEFSDSLYCCYNMLCSLQSWTMSMEYFMKRLFFVRLEYHEAALERCLSRTYDSCNQKNDLKSDS